MKKVLFTATVDSHILNFHIPYLEYFKNNGYEVHVATNGNEEIPFCDKKHKVSFERSPFKKNNFNAYKKLKTIMDEEKFDLIHTHTPMGGVVTRLAAINSRRNGTRVIYTAHGLHFYKGAPKKNWILYYPVEKLLSLVTDDLITINQEDYDIAKKKFKSKNIYFVNGVGVNENEFKRSMSYEEKLQLRKNLGLEENNIVLIYVAEISKRKNQEMLIKVMEELNDDNIKLLLVGSDSLNGKINKLISEKNLGNRVNLLGFRQDVAKLIEISDIYVSTSNQEGLPVNIMEAMNMEIPIIATDCRGNRDLIVDRESGFLVPLNDVDNFVDKIKTVLREKGLVDKMIEKSKDRMERYCLDTVKKEMIQIYEKRQKETTR